MLDTADEGEFWKRELVNRKMNRAVILVQTKTQIINILCGFSSMIFLDFFKSKQIALLLDKAFRFFLTITIC